MTEKNLEKMVKAPIAKPGMDAFGMSAPILIQMNQEGRWENHKPKDVNENDLKAIVQQLVGSKALSAVQSYCCQCAAENQNESGKSNYVPVIMMPIYSADQCPFDLQCEIPDNIEHKSKTVKKSGTAKEQEKQSDKDESKKKLKKRTFLLQRLTDFDLLSQCYQKPIVSVLEIDDDESGNLVTVEKSLKLLMEVIFQRDKLFNVK